MSGRLGIATNSSFLHVYIMVEH